MAEGQKRETFKTPIIVAKWVTLGKPDTKFKPEGEYRVTATVPKESAEAAALVKKIDAEYDNAIAAIKQELLGDPKRKAKAKGMKVADKPYKVETDAEGNETGNLLFTFKAKASGEAVDRKTGEKRIWKFKPAMFDSKGTPIPEGTTPYGGTKLRVAYQCKPFFTDMVGAGLSLSLQAVQILDLRTGGGRDAAAFGFEEEEGYTAEAAGVPAEGGAESGADF